MKHAVEVKSFLRHHFRHFNSAAIVDAAEAYSQHIEAGGRMLIAMAGAMSTAEIGLSLAEMIREGKVHAISCTGANLEEDLFNLVAHHHYRRIPNWRDITPQEEQELLAQHLNRVTDTCIPEAEAIRRLESLLLQEWQDAELRQERLFPHEFLYRLIRSGKLEPFYQIDPKDSWMVAAAEKNLPIFVPGWEDSTTGNIFTSYCLRGLLKNPHTVRSGVEYMMNLAQWYRAESQISPWGFFQVGGGIAGDFPICVVPMLRQDMELEVPLWSYFCQISDSTTSYGSYSGATPNEKITWEKLGPETPKFMVESDATIVAPLVFAYVLADKPGKVTTTPRQNRKLRPALKPAAVLA